MPLPMNTGKNNSCSVIGGGVALGVGIGVPVGVGGGVFVGVGVGGASSMTIVCVFTAEVSTFYAVKVMILVPGVVQVY